VVSAWPEPPFARFAGVCDGVEAIASGGATTETRLNRAAEERDVPAPAQMKTARREPGGGAYARTGVRGRPFHGAVLGSSTTLRSIQIAN